MTDTSSPKKGLAKWLLPLLAALALVAFGLWAFNRGADDGDLSERMASDPLSRQTTSDNPDPPQQPVSTMVPDNENGNASVITEADAARNNAQPGADRSRDGQPGAPGAPAPANTQPAAQ
jgi:hypothetical protein